MPILTIRHVTTYHYKQPVAFGEHRMMLRPRDDDDQKVLEIRARNHARAEPTVLDARYTRQSCCDRPFRGPGLRASLRKHHSSRPRAGRLPRRRYRGFCPDPSVCLPSGRQARSRARHRAAIPASQSRSLGRRISARGRIGRHPRASRGHDANHQADLQARGAAREGYPGPSSDPEARERELSRRCRAHDRGAALAWHRCAVRVRISASCR